MKTAELFRSGRSQAVRLPKEFRFRGKEVRIWRHGTAIVLKPVVEDWSWLDAIAKPSRSSRSDKSAPPPSTSLSLVQE